MAAPSQYMYPSSALSPMPMSVSPAGYSPIPTTDSQFQQQQQQQQQQNNLGLGLGSSSSSGGGGGGAGISPMTPSMMSPMFTEKVRLADNAKEREQFDNMADLYSILVTTERLEKAFIKDSIRPDEYTNQCSKLISKFKALQNVIKEYVPDINQFISDYKISCSAAVNRLITIGVPATVEFGDTKDVNAVVVAETVAYFITVMDSLKLELRDVDQIQPPLNDLMSALNKCAVADFDGKEKIRNWLIRLNQMRASDKLDEEDIRQMLYDLESAYSAFHKLLKQ